METNAYDKMKQLLKWNDENIRMKMKAKEESRVSLPRMFTAHTRPRLSCKQSRPSVARVRIAPSRPACPAKFTAMHTRATQPNGAARRAAMCERAVLRKSRRLDCNGSVLRGWFNCSRLVMVARGAPSGVGAPGALGAARA